MLSERGETDREHDSDGDSVREGVTASVREIMENKVRQRGRRGKKQIGKWYQCEFVMEKLNFVLNIP